MKKKDQIDLKSKPAKELLKSVLDMRKALTEARLDLKLGKNKNVHSLNSKRKELARMLTFLRIQQIVEVKEVQKDQDLSKTTVLKKG